MNIVGRPRNESSPRVARQDEIIAYTVSRLIFWGFPQRRDGVFQSVARAIESGSGFADHGREIGAHRVEKIYKDWKSKEVERNGSHLRFQRWRYTRESLARNTPRGNIYELACELLRNQGKWESQVSDGPPGLDSVSLELAPKAKAELEKMPKLKRLSNIPKRPLFNVLYGEHGRRLLIPNKRGSKP